MYHSPLPSPSHALPLLYPLTHTHTHTHTHTPRPLQFKFFFILFLIFPYINGAKLFYTHIIAKICKRQELRIDEALDSAQNYAKSRATELKATGKGFLRASVKEGIKAEAAAVLGVDMAPMDMKNKQEMGDNNA